MQTEQDFWADFDRAQSDYITLRAAKGFPFVKPEPNAPLPAWVLRNNERPKPTFVTRPHTQAATPTAKSVQKPATPPEPLAAVADKPATPPEPLAAVADKPAAGLSFAAQVRAVIAEAKPKGWTQEQVVEHAVTVLNMKRTSAINCVKHNWDRVKE